MCLIDWLANVFLILLLHFDCWLDFWNSNKTFLFFSLYGCFILFIFLSFLSCKQKQFVHVFQNHASFIFKSKVIR
jgi:hypothetical protein